MIRLYHSQAPAAQARRIGTIRLLLVDDEPAVLKGLRMRLGVEPDMDVVGAAEDGEAALALAKTLHPDVVLMDVALPKMDGITATEELHARYPHIAVIMLSMHDDAHTQERAEHAGAVAFVPKRVPTDMLLATIRQAAQMPPRSRAIA
jgi:DNA-binding NarL/FixJ family response regulator